MLAERDLGLLHEAEHVRDPRPSIEMEGGTVFHFVDANPYEALDLVREAAGDLDVRIGGGPTVVREFAVTLAQKARALRYDEDTITDTMWTLAPDAYVRLVHDAGWPVEQFQAWLADLLQRMFLE